MAPFKIMNMTAAYSYLGSILSKNGNYEEALEWHRKALDVRVEQLGDSHPDVVLSKAAVKAAENGQPEDEIVL